MSDFRNAYDRIFRLVNADYHACVSHHERLSFAKILSHQLSKILVIECKRANAYDKEQYERAINAAKACLLKIENLPSEVLEKDH